MSSTGKTKGIFNDHASSATSPVNGTAKTEVLYAKQRAVKTGRLRLDALTIAGLTGTPHYGGSFFASSARPGASASPQQSPTRSDDTLGSIQESSIGDENKDGGGSSVLSDELGEIAFTDDEQDNSGRESGEGDDGGGDAAVHSLGVGDCCNGLTATMTASENGQEEQARAESGTGAGELRTEGRLGQGEAAAAATATKTHEIEDDQRLGLATASGPPPDPRPAIPETATASGAERCGSGGATPPATSGASSPLLSSRNVAQAIPSGSLGVQHRRHRPRASERPNAEEQQQRSTHSDSDHRGCGGRSAETVGTSADNTTSSDSCTPSTRSCGAPATSSTSAADAASCAVSGADRAGGAGVSCSPLQAVPAGIVPTVTCKVLVVGNAKCGKSSIISRFVNNRFSSDYRSTVGADYAMKDVALQGGRQVRLQLWDIAGQDRFAKLTRAYFRRAKGAVVVCDVTREGTFDAIVRWKDEIDLWCQNERRELPVYLFANKCDLLTDVQDSFVAGARMEKTCRDSGFAGWYVTSAKRGDNINTAMTKLLDHALKAEDERNRNREKEGGRSASNSSDGANGDQGGGPKGEAFQLSSRGHRDGGGLAGQQGACCA